MDLRLMMYLACALVSQQVYLQFVDVELGNAIQS